jgi:hypothetical protein
MPFLPCVFQNPELQVNFNHLFLLTVEAYRMMDVFPVKIKKELKARRKEFVEYIPEVE